MGERRQDHDESDQHQAPGSRGQRTPGAPGAQSGSTLATADLQAAARAFDEELDRQQRLYKAAHELREAFGVSAQNVLQELSQLDQRRAALAKEIGEHESHLVQLRSEVADAEGVARRHRTLAQEIGQLEARKASLQQEVGASADTPAAV